MSNTIFKQTSHPRDLLIKAQNKALCNGWSLAQVKNISKESVTHDALKKLKIKRISVPDWSWCFPTKETTKTDYQGTICETVSLGVGILTAKGDFIELTMPEAKRFLKEITIPKNILMLEKAIRNAQSLLKVAAFPSPTSLELPAPHC